MDTEIACLLAWLVIAVGGIVFAVKQCLKDND
jgi:hypothetical protein